MSLKLFSPLTRCQTFHLKCTKFNFGWGKEKGKIGREENSGKELRGKGRSEGEVGEERCGSLERKEGEKKGVKGRRRGSFAPQQSEPMAVRVHSLETKSFK